MKREAILNLQENESVVAVIRRHWLAFLSSAIITFAMVLFFAIIIFVGNSVVNDLSREQVFSILGDNFWLFRVVLFFIVGISVLVIGGLYSGKYFLESSVCSNVLNSMKRHYLVVVALILALALVASLSASLVSLDIAVKQLQSEALGQSVGRNISDHLGQGVLFVIGGVYALSVVLFFFISWLDYYLDVFVITDRRVMRVEQVVLFGRKVSETSLQHIQDVSSRVRGVVNSTFNVGTIFIETAGENDNFSFEYVQHPTTVASLILKLQQGEWSREGVKDDLIKSGPASAIVNADRLEKMIEEREAEIDHEIERNQIATPVLSADVETKAVNGVEGRREIIVEQEVIAEKEKHYSDGRVIVEEGVIWQSDQELTEDIRKTLDAME